ncbi:Glucose-6-phosphatase [Eumeta japonica]|uniref:glucose-6-phosphatase n=1 Tax=Eumeta variegata TaxID=151549 RepID=A0A4C1X825_EUMVA|nr:Glucose-6-phosphatase [Eumeta japonica]
MFFAGAYSAILSSASSELSKYFQNRVEGSEDFVEHVNELANPHYAFEIIFPLVCIIDSVFAAQFLLCISFGSWLNTVMKWWLLEDRPYWWVQNTSFYRDMNRPQLHQYSQTCETGPGSPSGHSAMIAMQLVLYLMWISHFMNDSDPYIWGVGRDRAPVPKTVFRHVLSVIILAGISVITYFALKFSGLDPEWSIKLAYRWCEHPDNIRVSSLPLFALVQALASLLAWALAVTPEVAKYRHYTSQRSLLLAIISTYVIVAVTKDVVKIVDKENEVLFYALLFAVLCLRAVLLIRVVPFFATFFYRNVEEDKKKKKT